MPFKSYSYNSGAYAQRQQISDALRTKKRVATRAKYAASRYTAAKRQPAPQFYQRQVKALIAARKKDAQDVPRDVTNTGTNSTCLTSTSGFGAPGTAASGTGVLYADADEVLINSVRLKGVISLPATLELDTVNNVDTYVRHVLVWFYKPLLVGSAAGTLPPVTEVLVTDEVHAMPVQATANGGRFVILSDKMFNLGVNTFQAATAVGAAVNTGKSKQYFDYTVKVNKTLKYFAITGGTTAGGGHYDSDVPGGMVDRGLLVLYHMCAPGGAALQAPVVTMDSRLNYTG